MIKVKYSILLILLAITTSCRNQKMVLIYSKNIVHNSKYVIASDLKYFFSNKSDINRVCLRNEKLNLKVEEIKQKIITKNQIITPDDSYYVFAFIIKKDTLFADDRLEFWRYGDRGVYFKLDDFEKKKILKHYKIHPDQW
ncbi:MULTISPECIES: hypothetical protein [unclassified Chryseobacterium]|uniref:hypothetical protein n=1 Tax=unclassified Chryseobacterium TaxID=2593645 RepID=UPI001AE1F981|nr:MULTISPECIES: hypothetical protein [unclassified Chryseobacterium]MBP1163234.1 hypothetical protein [Chryseobacterium sp. PvR013]MDR4892500.1 hypothetical protein [Chryseobacterium sp. CFS7]